MFKTALMAAFPAALLTASPATAAVELVLSPSAGSPTMPYAFQSDGTLAYFWFSQELGKFVVSANPQKVVFIAAAGPGRVSIPGLDGLAASMPEPMSWAMMLVGLGVVGWTLRDRSRHTLRRISFS